MNYNSFGGFCGMDIYVLIGVALVAALATCYMYCVKHDHDIIRHRHGLIHDNNDNKSSDDENDT